MQHTTPTLAPDGSHYEWGHVRIVHAQRARKLRKRGVFLQPTDKPGQYRWFESEASYTHRMMIRYHKHMSKLFRKRLPLALKALEASIRFHVLNIQTATGSRLDDLASLPTRPAGWTDEMVRHYALDVWLHNGSTHGHQSPVLSFFYRDSLPHTVNVDLG